MRTAIFGGTFDPVHNGHIMMAKRAIEEFELEKLVIVPNGNPPHKTGREITDFAHRYSMAELAFGGMDKIELSRYEGEGGYRYSIDTMRHFRAEYGEDTAFVIGADSLLTIHKWYRYETLLSENSFVVFRRRGDSELCSVAQRYRELYGAKIAFSDMDYADISSTDIRLAIQNGEALDGLIPQKVLFYIRENGLYGGKNDYRRN